MRNIMLLHLWFLLVCLTRSLYASNCYRNDLFSTKTPYSLVQNDDINIIKPDDTCKPVHINMIHRHGHRYPSMKDMKKMDSLAEVINKASKVSPGVDLKLPWHRPYTFEQEKILTTIGEEELFGIGKRIVSRFPDIFQHAYTPFNFTFQSTCKLRCTHSAISLAAGLFDGKGGLGNGKYQPISLETHPCHDDKVLRFFDHCENYLQHVKESGAAKKEMKTFLQGPQIAKVLEKIMDKLGGQHINLKPKHLKPILVVCAYEIGMHGGSMTSGFCSLLDVEDRQVLEYLLDLGHFYERSAGHKINYQSACPLLSDFVTTMKRFVKSPSNGKIGVFRSAHAETIIPLFALLNVSMDSTLMTAENFEEMKVRNFRGSCLAPYSGNLYFVLFECGSIYKIQLYINENLVRIPCCESSTNCDFVSFLQCYETIVNSCHFDEICKQRKVEL